MAKKKVNFSVLMAVYYKENSFFLKQSLDSIMTQTLLPDEVVLVKDGKLTEDLDIVIQNFRIKYPKIFNIVSLPKNKGLANALNEGLKVARNSIIARMDSDDVCFLNRFEVQIDYMIANDLDIVGGQIVEFSEDINKVVSIRKVPLKHKEIIEFMKFRSPFSHPTVIIKKECFERLNGYDINIFPEDYDFFVRAYLANFKFGNVEENVLYFRLGEDHAISIKRRWGKKYAIKEFKLYNKFLRIGYFNYLDYVKVIIFKIPLRILPFTLYRYIYFNFFR